MAKITNTAQGARGVHTVGGLVMVEPGQTVDVDLAPNEELYEGLVEGSSGFESMTKAELKAVLDERGVAYEDGDTKADLLAKIEPAS